MSLRPPQKDPPKRNWRGFVADELAKKQAEWRTENGSPHTAIDVLHEWALEDNAAWDELAARLTRDVLEQVGLKPLTVETFQR